MLGVRPRIRTMEVVLIIVAVMLNLGLRYVHNFRGHATDVTHFVNADSLRYCRIACGISKTGRFAFVSNQDVFRLLEHPGEAGRLRVQATATATDAPLWPFLLSGMLRLTHYNVREILELRCLIDAATVALFAYLLLLSGVGFGPRAVALLLFAANPAWLLYSTALLTEPFTLFIVVSYAVLFARLARSESSARLAALTGVGGGLVMLEHPFYGLFPIISLLLLYGARIINRRALAIAIVGILAIVSPWMIRNMVVMHAPQPLISTYDWPTARSGWNAGILGSYRNTNWDLESDRFVPPNEVLSAGPDEIRLRQLNQRRVFQFLRANWRIVPAIVMRKLVGAITPIPETARGGWLEDGRMLLQLAAFIPVAFVMFLGIAPKPFRILVVSIMVTNLISSEITFPTVRFRFPLIWAEMLAIALFLDWAARRLRARSDSRQAPVRDLPDDSPN